MKEKRKVWHWMVVAVTGRIAEQPGLSGKEDKGSDE
jgi:hypothetical protein